MDITEMVKQDLEARAVLGEKKYGTRLDTEILPQNGLSALHNAYEEALDLVCYLRKALAEEDAWRGGQKPGHLTPG